MQTVTFLCERCGKLMGVSSAFLGQQVRCPHCQQAVQAPASAPAPAPVPAPQPEATQPAVPQPAPLPIFMDPTISFDHSEQDSIFTPPEADDLFSSPPAPRMELPPVPAPTLAPEMGPINPDATMAMEEPIPTLEPTQADNPMPVPVLESTLAFLPSAQDQPPTEVIPVTAQEAAPFAAPGENGVPGLSGVLGEPQAETQPRVRPQRQVAGSSLGFWILILSLISYSVLATIFVVILVIKQNFSEQRDILDRMPDVKGDNPGARKGEKASWAPDEKRHRAAVPAEQCVGLERTLRIGDIEVTPQKVEQKTVRIFVEGSPQPEPCQNPSLVLYLRLRNVSKEYAFTPLDNYFDRFYQPGSGDSKPLTCLEIGNKRFYGGPGKWYPRDRDTKKKVSREWVEGRDNYPKDVPPGQADDTLVCTDGQDPRVMAALADYSGALLWRVHLRRGVVEVGGREVPATTVVGVQFSTRDIIQVD